MRDLEKSTIYKFVSWYFITLLIFLSIIALLYYHIHKKEIITNQKNELILIATNLTDQIVNEEQIASDQLWATVDFDHNRIDGNIELPKDPECKNFEADQWIVIDGDLLYLISPAYRYIDAAAIVVATNIDNKSISKIRTNVIIILFVALLFFLIVGWRLTHLFLRPIRESVERMDRFVKDTTHELATPISAILMSIESLDESTISDENSKKISRIKNAAKSLYLAYEDLGFVLLNSSHKCNEKELVDMSLLIRDRVEFFDPLIKQKSLGLILSITKNIKIKANQKDMIKVFDNLLSNAIKYNNIGKNIYIKLSNNSLKIADQGDGIDEADQSKIFERYKRANFSQGGFGIGLSIVKELCEKHNIDIKLTSNKNGSEFALSWQSSH